MSKMYSEEEKRSYLDSFRVIGESKTAYARENNIPEATFRAWVKEEEYQTFGVIRINNETPAVVTTKKQSTIFSSENIRIELKEGFNKVFLRKVVEVLISIKYNLIKIR